MENFKYSMLALIAFAVSMYVTIAMIPILKNKQFGQYIREEGPEAHKSKAGTPTMGGIAIIAGITMAIVFSMLTTGDFIGKKLAIILTMIAFGVIGFIDDYNKVAKKQNEGLTPKQKLGLQIVFGIALAAFTLVVDGSAIYIPFAKIYAPCPWWLYIIFVAFILVAMSNAVNLTDGLDGLASSNCAIVGLLFSVVALTMAGGMDESMFAGGQAIFGACIGFLMLNKYPAKIFMGDTGSMALGGALSATAIVGHMEWLLPIAGLLFVIEALSVIIQVTYFKKTGGKRIFRMAPIHHHFELGGWSEVKVVLVFSIFTVVCCIIAGLSVI